MFLFFGCATQKKCSEKYPCIASTDTFKSVSIIYKDTIVNVPVNIYDSASYRAFLECDSLGQVRVKGYETKLGQLLKLNTNIRDNVLNVNCAISYKDSLRIALQSKETIVNTNVKQVSVPKIIYQMKWYQQTMYYFGWFMLLVALSQIAYYLIKFYLLKK